MKIEQIRNATNKIQFGDKTFLLDPWLAPQYGIGTVATIPGHPFTVPDPVKEQIPMPLFGLPESVESILAGVDAYILTHIHPDHIDMDMAQGTIGAPLDHSLPIFTQDEADAAVLRKSGFTDVRLLTAEGVSFGNVTLHRAPTRHGLVKASCEACGVVFEAAGEKKLYVTGDTVWYQGVQDTLLQYKPDVVTLNACAAELVGFGRLIMDDEDVDCVHQSLPEAKLFLTHFDNVAHASITRMEMRGRLQKRGITDYDMPEDGETVEY